MQLKAQSPAEKSTESGLPELAIRQELNRIVRSKAFRPVDRLQRFLAFVTEEVLAGRGDRLKEYPIGVDVFEKDSSFDPRMDPIVRVQARRLRMRLTTYYLEEGVHDDIIIELPKGGYAPTFRRAESVAPRKPMRSPALIGRNTVAVAPFQNLSDSPQATLLARGLTQQLLHVLTGVGSILLVTHIPQTEALSSSDAQPALVVTGTIRLARESLRITTTIIDTIRGCYLWSDSIDRPTNPTHALQDFSLQDEIAQKLLTVLQAEIANHAAGSSHRASNNLAAHNLYLQGRYHLSQRTERGLRRALDFFEKTLAEDPRFAPAYAGLADAYSLLAHYGVAAPVEVWTKVASNASQAVLADDESSEAHASLGHAKATQDWDWAGAEQEFRRAAQLDPRNATAHHWYAVNCLAPLGRLEEALEEVLLAQALDPVSSIIARDIAVIQYYKGDYDAALEQCDHTIEQNPHFSAVYWTLGLIQEQRGDLEEAAAAFRRAIELSPPSPRVLGALGRTLALSGRTEEAEQILQQLEDLSSQRYITPIELALIDFALKRPDEGFRLLTKAFQDRCFELISIKVDPRFNAVRKDPRFDTLFHQLNLP